MDLIYWLTGYRKVTCPTCKVIFWRYLPEEGVEYYPCCDGCAMDLLCREAEISKDFRSS